MKPRDIALPGLVLLLGILIGTYLLAPVFSTFILTSAPPLLIAIIYYGGPPILTLAAAGFSISWFRDRMREDRHRQEILQVVKMPVTPGGVDYTSSLSGGGIVQRPLAWAESHPIYPYTMAHLANYRDTISLLEAARGYSDKHKADIVQTIHRVETLVDKKLQSFKALPSMDTPPAEPQPYYLKHLIRYAIYADAKSLLEKGVPRELRMVQLLLGKRKTNQLYWGTDKLAVGNKTSLDRLTKKMNSLTSDPQVKEAVAETLRLRTLLGMNAALTDFETRMKQIVLALSAGKHALPGRCERCPGTSI